MNVVGYVYGYFNFSSYEITSFLTKFLLTCFSCFFENNLENIPQRGI